MILKVDSAVLQRHLQSHRLVMRSEALLDDLVGGQCMMTKYRLKNCSIASLVVVAGLVHLVNIIISLLRDHPNAVIVSQFLTNPPIHLIGGGFFDSPQFVFNLGGGPGGGFRVHQFGGMPGQRTTSTSTRRAASTQNTDPPDLMTTLLRLLPFFLFFLFPLISNWFAGQTPTTPTVRFEAPIPPHTEHRITPKLHVDYYVNPNDIADYSSRKLNQFDQRVEVQYVSKLQHNCESELLRREGLIQEAQGWFSSDTEKIKRARAMVLHNCKKLDELHLKRTPY